jgi:hypothetical protein
MHHSTRVVLLTTSFIMAGIAGTLRGRPGLTVHEVANTDDLCAPGVPVPDLVLYDIAEADAAQVLACLAVAPAVVGLDLRRDRAMTLMREFHPLATVDDLAALFTTLGIEAQPAQVGPAGA